MGLEVFLGGMEILAHTEIGSPDCPAGSESLYWLIKHGHPYLAEPTALGRPAQSSLLRGSTGTGRTPFSPFITRYRMGIGYFGEVKGGGVKRVFLVGLGVGVWDCRSLDSSSRSRLNLVGQPMGRDCCPDSSWGLRRRPGYVEKLKLVWRWVILNSLFRFYIWQTGRLPSVIYDVSMS